MLKKFILIFLGFTLILGTVSFNSSLLFAMTESDQKAITRDVPFYDDASCIAVNSAGTGIEELRFPDCITDMEKCAQVIDDYIKNYGSGDSPMVGMGNEFCDLGKQYDVNPALAVAFAQHESSIGTAGVGAACTNPFNNRVNESYPECTNTSTDGFALYPSWSDALEDFYELISGSTYMGNPDVKTLEDIIAIYAPEGDGDNNNESYLNAIVDVMEVIMKDLCGTDSSSSSSSSTDSSGTDDSSEPDDTSDAGTVEGVDTITDKDGNVHKIPAKSGKIGYEQHLVILGEGGDGGDEKKHYEITDVPEGPLQNGYVGLNAPPPYNKVPDRPPPNPYAGSMQTIAWNYGRQPLISPIEEQYYIAMRWLYEGGDGNEDPAWYGTYPRVIVTNKDNGKQVIAAAGDFGPAEGLGRVAGTSAGVTDVIKAKQDDSVLTFQWAKDQSLEPGPVDGSSTSGISEECTTNTQVSNRTGDGTDDNEEDVGSNGDEDGTDSDDTDEDAETAVECDPGDENCVKCEGDSCVPCESGDENCVKCEGDKCIVCTNDKCFECTGEGVCVECTGDKCTDPGTIPPPETCKKGEKLNQNGKCIKCKKNENCQPPKPPKNCEIGIGKGGFVFPLCTTKKELKDYRKKHTDPSPIPCNPSNNPATNGCHHDYFAADIGDPPGTDVIAAMGGKVVQAEDMASCDGSYDSPRVRIHGQDGHWYYYQHMKPGSVSGNKIKVGVRVDKAQQLGKIGQSSCAMITDPHLHFDMSNVDNGFIRSTSDNYAAARKKLIDPWPWVNSSYENLPAK